MEKDLYEEVVFNMLVDLKKKDIDRFTKAKLIKTYIERHRISERELARQIGVHASTLEDWLLYNNITEEEYGVMKGNGLNDTDIYNVIRNAKHKHKKDYVKITKFDFVIEEVINKLKPFVNAISKEMVSGNTDNLLVELNDIVNHIRMKIERNGKNGKI